MLVDCWETQTDYYYQMYLFNWEMLVDNDIRFPGYIRYEDPPFFVRAMAAARFFYLLPICSYVYRIWDKNIE